jgi:uncharacterized metal-binding protein
MANYIATCLDQHGYAEMSCIAGVGGDVPSLVGLAKSGRSILALDGCHLHCVKNCLARHGISPRYHVTLTKFGIRKRARIVFREDDAVTIYRHLVEFLDGRTRPDQPWMSLSQEPTSPSVGSPAARHNEALPVRPKAAASPR